MNKNDNDVVIGNSDYDRVALDSEKIVNGEVQCLTVGVSGSGKSYLTRNIIESLYAKKLGNILVIDPEGEYLSLRKLFDFVVLGLDKENCDIMISEENAAELATSMRNHEINVIIDLSYADEHQRQEIASNYINAIIDTRIYSPLQIIIEEMSRFTRRGINTISSTKCITSLRKLTQLGRMRGISTFCNTQRFTQLPIDIRSDYNTMIIGKCLDDADIKRNASRIGLRDSSKIRSLRNYEFIVQGNGITDDNSDTFIRFESITPKSEHSYIKIVLISLPKSETVIKWIELMGK